MSVNRNRAKFNKAQNRREYRLIMMRYEYDYCHICQKRAGSFYAQCDGSKRFGWHGNGKQIFAADYRAYKTWKHNRKTKLKLLPRF